MKHIKNCSVDDIIMDSTGNKARVIARLDDLIFRSEFYRYDFAAYRPLTVQEAQQTGWKVLTRDGYEVMDKKEVERLMHIKIK